MKFLTKLIRKTYVGNPLYLLYKKEGICVCVLEWSIFTNSIKNTALNKKDYFLVRHGGWKKISQVYGLHNSKNISF